jgi:hypothetical protein
VSKKHLPKAVFEVAAVAVARIHLATAKPLAEVASSIWAQYERQCEDPSADSDMTAAADALLNWLREKEFAALPQLLRHFQYFCQAFEDNGRPKKRRLFDGLRFQKEDHNPQRVPTFVRKAQVYCVSAQSSLVPLAPDSYQ